VALDGALLSLVKLIFIYTFLVSLVSHQDGWGKRARHGAAAFCPLGFHSSARSLERFERVWRCASAASRAARAAQPMRRQSTAKLLQWATAQNLCKSSFLPMQMRSGRTVAKNVRRLRRARSAPKVCVCARRAAQPLPVATAFRRTPPASLVRVLASNRNRLQLRLCRSPPPTCNPEYAIHMQPPSLWRANSYISGHLNNRLVLVANRQHTPSLLGRSLTRFCSSICDTAQHLCLDIANSSGSCSPPIGDRKLHHHHNNTTTNGTQQWQAMETFLAQSWSPPGQRAAASDRGQSDLEI
jgi:hypothetical protein